MFSIAQNNGSAHIVDFVKTITPAGKDLSEVCTFLNRAINIFDATRNDVFGENPLCAAELGLNLPHHQRTRVFRSHGQLSGYLMYLEELRDRATEVYAGTDTPIFNLYVVRKGSVEGFIFTSSDGNVTITGSREKNGDWSLSGYAQFPREVPHSVIEKLNYAGYRVLGTRYKQIFSAS